MSANKTPITDGIIKNGIGLPDAETIRKMETALRLIGYRVGMTEAELNERKNSDELASAVIVKVEEKMYELEISNDALTSARRQLGKDDGPFICDAIARLQNDRDFLLRKLNAGPDSHVPVVECQAEANKLRDQLRLAVEQRRDWEKDCARLGDKCDELEAIAKLLASALDQWHGTGRAMVSDCAACNALAQYHKFVDEQALKKEGM